MVKKIKKKGIVKQYKDGKKFFVVFEDNIKAMLAECHFNNMEEGDVIELEGKVANGWINNIDPTVKITKGTSTTSQATTTLTTTTEEPKKEEISIEINYLMKPRPNKRNQMFTMARALQDQAVEVLYLPISSIPDKIKEDVLAGYGTIKVEGNTNGKTFFVDNVLSFEPTIKIQSSEVELKDVRFSLYSLSFLIDNKYDTSRRSPI